MQIKRLRIDDYLCLVDFDISFQTARGGSSTILIGENGTGKTTMIETILEILMSFDSHAVEKRIYYNYEIEYEYADSIHVITKMGHRYCIKTDEQIFEGSYSTIRKVLKDNRIFPQRIIAFYSGENNKIAEKIQHQNHLYTAKCRKSLRSFLNVSNGDSNVQIPEFPKRKYNYCDEVLTPIYLTSILLGENSFEKDYLQNSCHFSGVDGLQVSVNLDKVEQLFGNPQFDEKYPTNFYTILDYIDQRFTDLFRRGFAYAAIGKGYFEIHKIEEAGANSIELLEFFEKLHSLFDAKYKVAVSIGDSAVWDYNLSEGQRQLIKILGMLGICKHEDCLVLMDEPDAHMNPRWKYEIKETIDHSLLAAENTQAIIATHDPLVINGVPKEFIRVFTFNEAIKRYNGFYCTKVIEPTEDTAGLGIDGLLQSEYYGLKTSYDRKTTDQFIRRQELYSKLIHGEADADEKEELRELTKEIGFLPISYNSIDFLYDDFIRAFKNMDLYKKEYLSYDEVQKRREKIKEIITALYEGER